MKEIREVYEFLKKVLEEADRLEREYGTPVVVAVCLDCKQYHLEVLGKSEKTIFDFEKEHNGHTILIEEFEITDISGALKVLEYLLKKSGGSN